MTEAPGAHWPNRSGALLAGRYRLQRRIAMGGMGEVYAASHVESGRRCAVKLMRPEFTRDAQMQLRFRFEAEAASGLRSEHIVEIEDFDQGEDGSPFLVMELLEGADLRRLLARRSRLGVADACELIVQACAGLKVAHERGVIHRDLKPENLFLTQRGERAVLKVLDFGIAKLRNQSLGTAGGQLLGTPEYMPPEQIRGDADVDQRADVYALGAILYELLTGALPHPGEGQHETISHVLFEPALPIRPRAPELPEALAQIVHKALAKAPAERFPGVAELADALSPHARAETLVPIEGAEAQDITTQPARASGPVEIETPHPQPTAVQPRAAWRRVYPALLALVTVAGLIGYLNRRPAQPELRALPDLSVRASPRPALPAPPTAPQLTAAVAAEPSVATTPPDLPTLSKPPVIRAKRRERASAAATPPPAQPSPPSTIEVQRGERTIIFKRSNPLRSD